jgi:L-alanine-DL-glutamate epimerase-like enolase superfamily enzyme
MDIHWQAVELKTQHPFEISRLRASLFHRVFVEIRDGDFCGSGEAAPSEYYGENKDTVLAAFPILKRCVEEAPDLFEIRKIQERFNGAVDGNRAAKAAMNMALYDLAGKKLKLPLHELLGLSAGPLPLTSFTIGFDTLPVMLRKVEAAEAFPILKIKVGLPGDIEAVKEIREKTGKVLLVDANGAWTAEEAVEKIRKLQEFGIELVEQPVPEKDVEGLGFVRRHVDVPILADESVQVSAAIPSLVGAVDGINIKLMKCGGITEALDMIATAKACGLEVMVGCMIESSLAITAAAPIRSWACSSRREDLCCPRALGLELYAGRTSESTREESPPPFLQTSPLESSQISGHK